MSVLERGALAPARPRARRPLAVAAGIVLAVAVAFLCRRIAPDAPLIFAVTLSGAAGLAVVALGLTLEDDALPTLTQGALAGAALAALGALLGSREARLRLFSLAMAALMAGLAVWLARGAARRPRMSSAAAGLAAATLALLCAYAAFIVIASRDLMIADFMNYRNISIMVARLADAGHWPLLLIAGVESIAQDYSWAPALAPGLALALTAPFSRAVYTLAILGVYATPAAIALGVLARDLACRVTPSPQPSPVNGRGAIPSPVHGRRWPGGPDEGGARQ